MACSLCHRSRTGGGLLQSRRGPYSDTYGNTDATPNSDSQSNIYAQSYPQSYSYIHGYSYTHPYFQPHAYRHAPTHTHQRSNFKYRTIHTSKLDPSPVGRRRTRGSPGHRAIR